MSDTFHLCETEVVPAYCWRAVQVGFDSVGEGLILYDVFVFLSVFAGAKACDGLELIGEIRRIMESTCIGYF